MACFPRILFQKALSLLTFLTRFLHLEKGKFFVILLSLFYIHFSFGNAIAENAQQLPQMVGILKQVMGQSTAECEDEYTDIKPTNEDFCSELNNWNAIIGSNCPSGNPLPTSISYPCSTFVGDDKQQGTVMYDVHQAVKSTLENGKAVCHCCMVPSMCLFPGGIGRLIDLLRVGNYAGLLMGLNNNKICAAIEKSQHISAGLDTASGLKCVHKGGRCKEMHGICVDEIDKIKGSINEMVQRCSGNNMIVSCRDEKRQLDDYIEELEKSSSQKCGTASSAGQNQLMMAGLTLAASQVARECKKDYKRNTKCDDKKDVELDECCAEHPSADACKQDKCEGQQGEDLDSCCAAHPDSAMCVGHVDSSNVCHATQLMLDPTSCMEKCREDSTIPGCVGFCNLQWHNEICPEVCKTYQMPRCEEVIEPGHNACASAQNEVCCTNPNGPDCNQFCLENPDSAYCQCATNPGRCHCDREEDAPYIPEGQCVTDLLSTECEDFNDPACALGETDSSNFPGDDGGSDSGTGSTGTPWVGPPPFGGDDDEGSGDSKNTPNSPTTYSAGSGSGGGGGLGGGGLGGGSGGGGDSDSGEGGAGEEEDDPYDNILAGLSGDQNQSPGYGSAGGGGSRGSRPRSGFDLKKFLPKKKKDKKSKSKGADRVPSSTDSIFDLSSQLIDRYCTNNNMKCNQ